MALVPCMNCGRTFLPESLAHHQKNCTAENPYKSGAEGGGDLKPCCKCGRKFNAARLPKHESVCKGTGGPNTLGMSATTSNFNPQTKNAQIAEYPQQKEILRPRAIMCYICGREYGTKSIGIHLKTCKEKFIVQESQKPANQRKALPQPPPNFEEVISKDKIT